MKSENNNSKQTQAKKEAKEAKPIKRYVNPFRMNILDDLYDPFDDLFGFEDKMFGSFRNVFKELDLLSEKPKKEEEKEEIPKVMKKEEEINTNIEEPKEEEINTKMEEEKEDEKEEEINTKMAEEKTEAAITSRISPSIRPEERCGYLSRTSSERFIIASADWSLSWVSRSPLWAIRLV